MLLASRVHVKLYFLTKLIQMKRLKVSEVSWSSELQHNKSVSINKGLKKRTLRHIDLDFQSETRYGLEIIELAGLTSTD